MPEKGPIRVGFSFYQKESDELKFRAISLRKSGVPMRENTVMRALIRQTNEDDMVARAIEQTRQELRDIATAAAQEIVDHPTADLSPDDVKKLDAAVVRLAKASPVSHRSFVLRVNATRTHIMRALLLQTPNDGKFVASMKQFLADNPNKPRGIHVTRWTTGK